MTLDELGKKLEDYQWEIFNLGRQADTFIEWCFEKKAMGLNQGRDILNEWRSRKSKYISCIKETVLDFQHYSRHDDTHSINILNAIELVLGRDRVMNLSASDLWLLLEAAYAHDLGMALTYKDLKGLWNSEEFRSYLKKALVGNDIDLANAANYYYQMDNLLNEKDKLTNIFEQDEITFSCEWPLEIQRNLMILTADYIRSRHHIRSKEFLRTNTKKEETTGKEFAIEDRMNNLIGILSELHGQNYEDIEKRLDYSALGFDVDEMHPRFIAVMLRLGDLLDIKNNRFNIRALEHFGDLPILSEYHLKKHKSITHFMISPELIEATAVSEEYEVCQVTGEWFQMLEAEVNNLICDWNRFVPEKLMGCKLQRCNLKVFYGKTEFSTKFQSSFEVDKKRLNVLMVGSNIYDSPLDCLREYIQNAMDASKMKLWMELKYMWEKNGEEDEIQDITPFDIKKSIYDSLAIEVKVSVNIKDQMIQFQIIDQGIGMETECVNSIAVVGRSWKQRKVYRDEAPEMPDWLRPTGGFGIGLQSAFMLTDKVTIVTKSIQETMGYRIELTSPKKGGSIFKIQQEAYREGTQVHFEVPIQEFYRLKEEQSIGRNWTTNKEEVFGTYEYKDGFLKQDNEESICEFIYNYVKRIIPDSLFPIRISGTDKHIFEYRSVYASVDGGFGNDLEMKELDEDYLYCVTNDLDVRIWDKKEHTFVYVHTLPNIIPGFSQDMAGKINHFCYKNVKVWDLEREKYQAEFYNFFSMCIDIMGRKMEDVLSIRRNAFAQEFNIWERYQKYSAVYIEILYLSLKENERDMTNINTKMNVFLYLLLAIQLLERKKLLDVMGYFQDKITNPKYVLMRKIKNGMIKTSVCPTLEVFESVYSLLSGDESLASAKRDVIFVAVDYHVPEEQIDMVSLETAGNGIYHNLDWDEMKPIAEIFDHLYEGTEVYFNPDICHALLSSSSRLPKHYFRLSEDTLSKGNNPVYAMISGINEDWNYHSQTEINEGELLEKAFRIWNKRYIVANVSCPKYNQLKVDKIPAMESVKKYSERKETYLISPIGYGVYTKVLLCMGLSVADISVLEDGEKIIMKRYITQKQFVQIVTEDEYADEYQFLISWVFQHQLSGTAEKLGKEDIDRIYKKWIEDIYTANFKKK